MGSKLGWELTVNTLRPFLKLLWCLSLAAGQKGEQADQILQACLILCKHTSAEKGYASLP